MTEETESAPAAAITKDAWAKRKVHEGVTLPSGAVVDVKVPNLATMITSGAIPNSLVDTAMRFEGGGPESPEDKPKVTPELLQETWEFVRFIVPHTVANPVVTEADVDDLPAADVQMLVSFALRQSDIDAVGHHLGGLETVRRFRELRGLITLDEALSDS